MQPAVQWAESAQSRQRLGQNLGFVHIPEEGRESTAIFTGGAVIESEVNTRPVCVSDG